MRNILLLVMICLMAQIAATQEKTLATPAMASKAEYICRMYCTYEVSDTLRKCRICGMDMELRSVVENPKEYKILSPQDALERIKNNPEILVLDVRSKEEYNDKLGHLENSVQIPINELEGRMKELQLYKSKTIIAYCSHGIRSARAAILLRKEGFTVFSLMGGLTKWNRGKFPVVRN